MRRISALVAVLLVFVTGCTRGAPEQSGGSSTPTSTHTGQVGPWIGPLNTTAVTVAKQLFSLRSKGKPVPQTLRSFQGFLLKDQSFQQYASDGTDFSYCVQSSSGWVAFDSTYGGVVSFGDQPPCSSEPMDQVVAVHQAAADLAAKVEEAAQRDGDPFANIRGIFDSAELPAGIEIGSTQIGYRVAQFCLQAGGNVWAAYAPKAPTADHVTVGILSGC